MRLHTDTLTYVKIRDTLARTIPGAWLDEFEIHRSQSRSTAFEVKLAAEKVKGRRRRNQGTTRFRDSDPPFVPTYDEWGAFLAALYEIDPTMKVTGCYEGRSDFHHKTRWAFLPDYRTVGVGASPLCPHGRDPEDCAFRGPCGDEEFLRPVADVVWASPPCEEPTDA